MRGLKCYHYASLFILIDGSHPSRVRGLKSEETLEIMDGERVAPFTGAWIEMHPLLYVIIIVTSKSHPSRVRGLKCITLRQAMQAVAGRTLHGCVD